VNKTPLQLTVSGTALPGRSCGPHRGVRVALQVGKAHAGIFGIVAADAAEASWTTEIVVVADGDDAGNLDFRGEAVHGRKGERFLYLVWLETTPGNPDTMFRRAKLQLDAVPAEVLARALRKGALRARLPLTAGDGLPVCASVRPPRISWTA
jgi:hypothetical protein